MKQQILTYLPKDFPWANQFHTYQTLDSTNDLAKKMASQGAPHGTVILADTQTAGHGRMGRAFHSPEGQGIYMSVILRPQCQATELMHLTCAAAVAVCDGIQSALGFRPNIKWTNDIVYNKRKLGGILTELSIRTGSGPVDYAVLGIGINCTQQLSDFPVELQGFVSSLAMATSEKIDRARIAASILKALYAMNDGLLDQKDAVIRQYRRDCITLGQEISLVQGDVVAHGRAVDIDSNGALLVAFDDGSTRFVQSGEVSIRGMYGYI